MKLKQKLLTMISLGLVVVTTACGATGPNCFKPEVYEWGSTFKSLRYYQGYHDPFSEIPVQVGNSWKSKIMVSNVKALVVPVDFTDYPADDPKTTENEEEIIKSDLNKAVFGAPEETRWHSLKSYYEATSFGQCKVSGEVVDTFHLGIGIQDFQKGKNFGFAHTSNPNGFASATSTNATKMLANAIQSMYDVGGSRYGEINLNDYDANKDGYIDSLIMIYTCPPHVRANGKAVDDDLFWAFRWSSNGTPTATAPAADSFFWASYETFFEGGKNAGVDSHTLIHEFGHILSLPDFYNYDYNGIDPMGSIDMMDHNIGDHNAFSKALLGWITPRIVTNGGTFELQSTTDTGDFLIIPQPGKWYDYNDTSKRWDGTMLYQFIMIEFITPTGVAKADGERPYSTGWPLYYNQPGIRIYHVDARIGQFIRDNNGYKFSGYTIATKYAGSGQGYCDFATSNTTSEMAFKDNPLMTLVSSTGENWKYRGTADNEDLYYPGDSLKGYKFFDNVGEQTISVGYDIVVKKINGNESATVQLIKRK